MTDDHCASKNRGDVAANAAETTTAPRLTSWMSCGGLRWERRSDSGKVVAEVKPSHGGQRITGYVNRNGAMLPVATARGVDDVKKQVDKTLRMMGLL